MSTIAEKVERDAGRGLRQAIGEYGSNDLETALQDTITDTLHALDEVFARNVGEPDPMLAALAGVERSISNYVCESQAKATHPDEDEDALGGFHNPATVVEVAGL